MFYISFQSSLTKEQCLALYATLPLFQKTFQQRGIYNYKSIFIIMVQHELNSTRYCRKKYLYS